MRRTIVVCLGIAAFLVATSGFAAPFAAKPPIFADESVEPRVVALDATGARYVAGSFAATADFDPGPAYRSQTALTPGGTPFIVKYGPYGDWIWTQKFGGTGSDIVTAITVSNGIVFVAGVFTSNDATFGDTNTISANTDANNLSAGFVIALDAATGLPKSTFHQVGVQTFGGTGGGRAAATSLCVVGTNLYVGGTFSSSGFGIGGSGTTNTAGLNDAFVACLDIRTGERVLTFGTFGLATLRGNADENLRGIVEMNGVLYLGGDTASTNFGIGATGTISTSRLYDPDAFVVALDAATAAPVTAFGGDGVVTFGGVRTEEGWGVSAAGGVVYLLGTSNGTDATIDGGSTLHPTINDRDAFVLALNAADGKPVSTFGSGGVVYVGGTGPDGTPTAVVATGSVVYVAGRFGGESDAGVGALGKIEKADSFVLALDPATGVGLPAFASDGVQTINGGDPAGGHVVASIEGFAVSSRYLALVGPAPIGTYYGPPAIKTKFPSVGAYLLLLDPTNGDALNLTGANRRPVFSTPVIATPNPAVAGKPVKFTAVATDPDKNGLHFAWTFGDGKTSAAKSPSHVFAAANTYSVGVVADDRKGGTTPANGIDLVVVAPGTPYFDVTKATVALKFNAPQSDVVTATGQIPLADGTSLAGKSFTLNVGGATKTFTLDVDGKTPKGDSTATVSKPKNGVAKFTAKIGRGDFGDLLLDENMTNVTTTARYTPVVVTVVFDGTAYAETVPLFWTAKLGRSGLAK